MQPSSQALSRDPVSRTSSSSFIGSPVAVLTAAQSSSVAQGCSSMMSWVATALPTRIASSRLAPQFQSP
jgi:hypothetical protein